MENFDACRDLSGRRYRYVEAERKLAEWEEKQKTKQAEKAELKRKEVRFWFALESRMPASRTAPLKPAARGGRGGERAAGERPKGGGVPQVPAGGAAGSGRRADGHLSGSQARGKDAQAAAFSGEHSLALS